MGRASGLQELSSAWRERARLVLVEGEAGIGKTRIVDELAQSVAREGARVLCGRWPEQELGPFAGFVRPIRRAVALVPPGNAAVVGELARLVPEILGEGAPAARYPDSAVERRLLFESIVALLQTLGPTLLCLDDLQHADASSFALLEFLAAADGLEELVILATVRLSGLGTTAAARLAETARISALRRIELGALEPADITRIVENVAGPMFTEDLLERVQEAAEGNAFFAEELCEHLLDMGSAPSLRPGDLREPLPRGVRDLLARRINSLPDAARGLLRAASVLGRDFDPWLAGELAGLQGEDLIVAGEDALLSGLVVEGGGGTLTFSHGLVHAAAEAEVPSVRKVALHRVAAVKLAETEPTDPERVADVARHWAAVAQVDSSAAPAAAGWAIRAGDLAAAAAATDEAIASYEQASEFLSATTAEHADALIRLGTAFYSCGRSDDADERFRAAFGLAAVLDDPELMARSALGLSRRLDFGAVDAERVQALERAIGRLDEHDREQALRPALELMLLRQLMFDRSPGTAGRQRQLRINVAEAVDASDPSAELLLLVGATRDVVPLIDPIALGGAAARIVGLATERRDLAAIANGWWMSAWSALERGERGAWDASLSAYAHAATELALPSELATAAALDACDAQIEGRTADAIEHSARALAHGREADEASAESLHLARAVLIGLDGGQAGALLPAMAGLAEEYAGVATFQAGLCMTAAIAGDSALAGRLLRERAEQGFGNLSLDVEWLAVAAFYSHACVLIGEQDLAEPLYALLAKTPATAVRVGSLAGWWGPVDHHLGGLCRLLGRSEEARERLEHAIAVAQAMHSAPFVARGRLELATTLEQAGDSDSLQRAAELRRRAITA